MLAPPILSPRFFIGFWHLASLGFLAGVLTSSFLSMKKHISGHLLNLVFDFAYIIRARISTELHVRIGIVILLWGGGAAPSAPIPPSRFSLKSKLAHL